MTINRIFDVHRIPQEKVALENDFEWAVVDDGQRLVTWNSGMQKSCRNFAYATSMATARSTTCSSSRLLLGLDDCCAYDYFDVECECVCACDLNFGCVSDCTCSMCRDYVYVALFVLGALSATTAAVTTNTILVLLLLSLLHLLLLLLLLQLLILLLLLLLYCLYCSGWLLP